MIQDFSVRNVILAVDPTDEFLRDLEKDRQHSFPAELREFADIAPDPTIWMTWHNVFQIYSGTLTGTRRHCDTAKILGLGAVAVREDEDIFSKGDDDGFRGDFLRNHLRRRYPLLTSATVIGMNTRACVAGTMRGAILDNLYCYGVFDLMADCRKGAVDRSVEWHREALLEKLWELDVPRSRFELIDKRKFIDIRTRQRSAAPTAAQG